MMNYATWECICHPSVAKDHDTLKGYNVTTGNAWTEFWGAQAASLQVSATCRDSSNDTTQCVSP